MKKPNFFIVGAAKCGTTSLASSLALHEEIFISKIKEPHYFIPSNIKTTLPIAINDFKEYSGLFSEADCENFLGEASVLYLPMYKDVIPRIKAEIGEDVKIIIILRNPNERMKSAFEHSKRFNAMETASTLEQALLEEPERVKKGLNPMLCYSWLSQYGEQCKAYFDAFEHVKVIFYEEFIKNQRDVLVEIFEFLGVNSENYDYSKNVHENKSIGTWKIGFVGRYLNYLLPGSARYRLREKYPKLYSMIFSLVKKVLLRKGGKIVLDQRFSEISKQTEKLQEFVNVPSSLWSDINNEENRA
ncbi:MAG: sulfotransferase domain-containing protein [Gammaproteobacteria bacterium]|nr:sulfotransferase domain-containing protein [Gammaproteobacteria bacterium]